MLYKGLITNNSIAKRLNKLEKDLPSVSDEDPVWDVIADYLS